MRAFFIGGYLDRSELDLSDSGLKLIYPANKAIQRPCYALFQIAHSSDRLLAFAFYAPSTWSLAEFIHVTKVYDLFRQLGVSTQHLRNHRCMEKAERPCLQRHFCPHICAPTRHHVHQSLTQLFTPSLNPNVISDFTLTSAARLPSHPAKRHNV